MPRIKKIAQSATKSRKRNNGRQGRIFVPEPERERIREMHISGYSRRKISKATGRADATVAKILKREDWPKLVEQMQEEFYGSCLRPALRALRRGIQSHNERIAAMYGWKVAERTGIIPPQMVAIKQWNTTMQDEETNSILTRLAERTLERKHKPQNLG